MESNKSGSSFKGESVDGQSTSTQLEALALFRRLVDLLASDATIDIHNLQEFRIMLRRLCEAAPDTVQVVATTIQEVRSSVNNSLQQSQDAKERDTSHAGKRAARKPVSGKDLSYRPPRSARAKITETSYTGNGGMPQNREVRTDVSVGDVVVHGVRSSSRNADAIVLQDQNAGIDFEAPSESVNAPRLEALSQPDLQQCIAQGSSVPEGSDPADREGASAEASKDTKRGIETTLSTSNKVENAQASVLPRPSTPLANAETDPAVVTPSKKVEDASTSPQTEEIHRVAMLAPLEGLSLSPMSAPGSSSLETISLIDLVIEAVRVIHQFSKYPHSAPAGVHSRILQMHRNISQEGTDRSTPADGWSDGSMWMRILEMGSSQKQKVTILNMIEYIGAWEWYDRQVNVAKATIHTKKGSLVDRKGAATHVLNAIGGSQWGAALRGRWISGVGEVAIWPGQENTDLKPENDHGGISAKDRQLQRKRISLQLSRGQKLSTKLVKDLGPGILFSPKIWEYTKMHGEHLDRLIKDIQADSRRMALLRILGPQLEQLVGEGRPDLHALFDALRQENLVSQKELRDLRETFALDSDPMPKGSLNSAVHRLIGDVSAKILGKRKLEDIDAVVVNRMPISCDIFNRLRCGERLNDDIINLAMNTSDKPDSVVHGYSVPLDEVGKTRTTRPLRKPLAAWARRVNRLREKSRNVSGNTTSLVYYCPLNHRNAHFTLLEINDQERVIRHYDSAACQTTIDGSLDLTRVARLIQEEFADLQYAYSEAPTPQQTDDWSCGIRVVWNFRRLSNGLPIGGWDAVRDPERMKMELVQGFHACVEASVMRKYTDEPNESSSDSERRGKSKRARSLGPSGRSLRTVTRTVTDRASIHGG